MAKGKSIPVKTEFSWDLLDKMLARVWWKLPADARQVLESRLTLVSDSEKWRAPGNVNGCTHSVPGGFVVWLNKINLIHCTEWTIQCVISHELAHAYLNHVSLPVIDVRVVEPEADRQAWAWGFDTWGQVEGYKSQVRRMWVKTNW